MRMSSAPSCLLLSFILSGSSAFCHGMMKQESPQQEQAPQPWTFQPPELHQVCGLYKLPSMWYSVIAKGTKTLFP